MPSDKLLREKLRVERDYVGDAHPFIALSYVVHKGDVDVVKSADRENPLPRFNPLVREWRA